MGTLSESTAIPCTAKNAQPGTYEPYFQNQHFKFYLYNIKDLKTNGFQNISMGKPRWLRIFDFLPARGSPRFFQCMLDEDLIHRATRRASV